MAQPQFIKWQRHPNYTVFVNLAFHFQRPQIIVQRATLNASRLFQFSLGQPERVSAQYKKGALFAVLMGDLIDFRHACPLSSV